MTKRSWFRKLFARGPRTPIRRAPQTRLGVEYLEGRIVPTEFHDVGGLRFLTPTQFEHNSQTGTYFINNGDSVSIGFQPDQSDPKDPSVNFHPLLEIDPSALVGAFVLDPGAQTFSTSGDVTMSLVAQGTGPNHDLPIFKQSQPNDGTDPIQQVFKIGDLLGAGVSIDATTSQPVTFPVVDWVNFQMTGLVLAPDDTGGKVGMQGTGTISSATGADLSSIGFIKDLQVLVTGSDYVWANADDITATGFAGKLDFSSNPYKLAGYTVTGGVTVGYSDPGDGNKRISIGGDVELTAPADSAFKLENVGGTISVSLGSEHGAPKFYGLTLDVDGTFKAHGLSVTTTTPGGVGFSYNFNGPEGPQWEVFGGVEFTIKDKAVVDITLGSGTAPGLVIQNGEVTKFSGYLNANFQLGPVVITTSQSGGATFEYDKDTDQFEMSGGVGIQIGQGDKQFTLNATLGDATDPGIIYIPAEGGLQQANFGITGSLSVGSLSFSARDAGFHWVKATATTAESWEIHGAFQIDFGAFEAGVELGTTDNPGIVVDENGFQLDGITVDVENVRLGPLNLQNLEVSYKADGDSYDVDVAVTVGLGSFVVGGEFVVIEGKLDSIELSYSNQEGLAIGETGVKLVYVDATVKNIENPSQIAVVGKVGVVYGETITMLGKEVNLFHAEGDLTVDAGEFVLDCTAQLGAYSSDGGHTWQGVLGTGDAKLSLNWRTQVYSLHIEADGVLGVFDIKGDLVFAPGRDILLLAEADVVIPSWVPFIGGTELAGLGFFFEHDFNPTSTTFAAWLHFDLFTDVTVGFEVVIDANGNSNWKLIGGSEVTGFRQLITNPDGQSYTYSVDLSDGAPEGTTSLLTKVDWSRPFPGVNVTTPQLSVLHTVNGQTTTITEDQFAANGIKVIDDARVTSGTSKVIQITNNNPSDPYAPLVGDYTLHVDIKGQNGNPFPSFPNSGGLDDLDVRVVAHSAAPVFTNVDAQTPYPLKVPPAPTGKFNVTVKGNADETYLQNGEVSVSLYRISSADPFRRPVFIQKVLADQPDPDQSAFTATFQVPIDGLDPNAYTLIAVVDDGTNPPVSTDPSPEFTPVFAVRGTVTNQNGTPLTGLPVFLDYNHNRVQDANEPGTLTGPDGYAFTAKFDSNPDLAPVPVGQQFDVVLDLPAPLLRPLPPLPPVVPQVPVTFDGTNTAVAPFTLANPQGISGVVYDDTNSNGNSAAGRPIGAAVVYLDTNDNGVRDDGEPTAVSDAGGKYTFAGLPAGTYNVRVDMSTVGHVTPAEAYVVPAGTAGTETGAHAGNTTYGMAFTTDRPVVITSLGVFDDNGDGLTTTLTAVLYDATTKVELARLAFTPQNPGTLVGGTRYLDLPKPIILPAGFKGMIVAYGFGATTDRAGRNSNYLDPTSSPWATDDGAGRLSFTGGFQALTPNTYPTIPDRIEIGTAPFRQVLGLPNPYAAGSFMYRDVPWAASPSSATSHQVTLDASGTDLVEGQNFGLLPPTLFFGQVTGFAVVGGQPQTVPQSGVPVGLLADRVVLAVDSGGGGPAGSGFTGDQYVTGGTEVPTATDIDTSGVPVVPPVDIYQTARVGEDTDAGDGGFTYTLAGLSPGSNYTVRLHFAEIEKNFEVAGQRKFNVSINGTQVLFDFDIIAATGGPNTAIARDFQATADINGQIVVAFTDGSASTPLVNAIQVLAPLDATSPQTAKLAIDAGGGGGGNFATDQYVTGGSEVTTPYSINTTRVLYPAPESVYQSVRSSAGGEFTYTLPGFEPGRAYTVRLHFAEIGVNGPGQREFNVDINKHRVLTDFDIYATAGGANTAITQDFETVADADGNVVVAFRNGSVNTAIVSGIEVFEPTNVVDTTTTDAEGNYALVAYGAGQYTVVQQPLAGWEQVAPNYSNPVFTPTTPSVAATTPVYAENSAVATADFNGDGRMDLAVASLQPWNGTYDIIVVSVLLSQPDGSFKTEQNAAQVYPNSVPLLTVGDFNGDHRPDLAFVHSGLLAPPGPTGSRVHVLLNTNDADEPFDFQHPIDLQPGDVNLQNSERYTAIASGDIDGDGKDDLVLGLSTARTTLDPTTGKPVPQSGKWVYVSHIATAPTYDPHTTGTPGTSVINKVAIADVDGNGYGDVIVAAEVPYDNIHDLPELLGYSVVEVGERGDATHWGHAASWVSREGPVTGLAVGPVQPGELPSWYTASPTWLYSDIYLDDRPIPSAGNVVSYQAGINTGTGDVPFPASIPNVENAAESRPKDPSYNFHLVSGLRLQDMNGDGLPDLVYLYAPTPGNQSIAIRINTGDGFDLTAPPSALVPLPSNLTEYVGDFVVADFNGDGLNDIFVAGTGQSPGMLFLNGTPQNKPGNSLFAAAGSWQAGLDFQNLPVPAKSAVRGQVFEDVNGDGTRNTGDKGQAGAVVFADLNGQLARLDAGEPQATTTATGDYTLPGMPDGTYSIGVVPDAAWKTTTTVGEFTEVTIANGSVEQADFGRTRRLIGDVGPQTVRAGDALDVTVPLTAAAAGHRLLYSLEGNVPAGMTINSATGELMWTPTAVDAGSHTATVRVRDPFDTRMTDTREVTIDVTARPADHLTIQVPSQVIARGAFSVTVRAEDVGGITDPTYTGSVTLLLASAPRGGKLSGVAVAPVVNGVARFSNLSLNVVGGGYQLLAASTSNLLACVSAPITVVPTTHFAITGVPASLTAGGSFTLTITALTATNKTDPNYAGTVQLSSTDPQAFFLDGNDVTFVAGKATATVTPRTAGKQTFTAADVTRLSANGTSRAVTVSAGAASHLQVKGYANPDVSGASHSFTVSALDPYNNVATTFRDTVTLSSTDLAATFPVAIYTFKASDRGTKSFYATLYTVGNWSLTATDTTPGAPVTAGSQDSISVVNLTAGISAVVPATPVVAVRGQPLAFSLSASQTGQPATTSFSYTINWGDGTSGRPDTQTLAGPTGTPAFHAYTTSGNYTITVTAANGGLVSPQSAALGVTIQSVAVEADPSDPTQKAKALFVGGTTGADTITLKPADASGTVNVQIGKTNLGNFKPTGHIVVYGQAGNDTIKLQTASIKGSGTVYVSAPALLFGGDGNDTLDASGSAANNVLEGGAGNDTLRAGSGRGLLVGGLGADVLQGHVGDDILVGGTTAYDGNLAALNAIMAEWGRTDADYATRVKHLSGTLGGGLNSGLLLTASTVHDDAAGDTLTGGAGTDWYFALLSGTNKDTLKDKPQGEVVTGL